MIHIGGAPSEGPESLRDWGAPPPEGPESLRDCGGMDRNKITTGLMADFADFLAFVSLNI